MVEVIGSDSADGAGQGTAALALETASDLERLPTGLQRLALQQLIIMHGRYPSNDYGFNACELFHVAGLRAAEKRGWVWVNRISERHFRYSITEAGRAAYARAFAAIQPSTDAPHGEAVVPRPLTKTPSEPNPPYPNRTGGA